jgi:hypothetical protein
MHKIQVFTKFSKSTVKFSFQSENILVSICHPLDPPGERRVYLSYFDVTFLTFLSTVQRFEKLVFLLKFLLYFFQFHEGFIK